MQVTYNGVSFPFVTTDRFAQTPVYEDGNYIHTRFELSITAVLNPNVPGLFQSGESFAAGLARVRHALDHPRRSLRLEVGGAAMLDHPEGVDCANGPLPGPLTVVRLDGDASAVVQWSVTTFRRDCPEGRRRGPPGRPQLPRVGRHRRRLRLVPQPLGQAHRPLRPGARPGRPPPPRHAPAPARVHPQVEPLRNRRRRAVARLRVPGPGGARPAPLTRRSRPTASSGSSRSTPRR